MQTLPGFIACLVAIAAASGCLSGSSSKDEPDATLVTSPEEPADSSPPPSRSSAPPPTPAPSSTPGPAPSPTPTAPPPPPPPPPPEQPEPFSVHEARLNMSALALAGANSTKFRIDPAALNVTQPAWLNLTVENGDESPNPLNHTLHLDAWNITLAPLSAGESLTVLLFLDQAGAFEYYCAVAGHKELGMKGTLNVADAPEAD